MRSYLQLRTFSRIRMRASILRESKRCNTNGRSVGTAGETMLKNKPQSFVKLHHCIIVSLSTFQPITFEHGLSETRDLTHDRNGGKNYGLLYTLKSVSTISSQFLYMEARWF